MPRIRAVVRGRVQGVFFRATTHDELLRLGLTGSATNQPDGSVVVVAEGERGALGELVRFLHVGPRHAHVTAVEVDWMA